MRGGGRSWRRQSLGAPRPDQRTGHRGANQRHMPTLCQPDVQLYSRHGPLCRTGPSLGLPKWQDSASRLYTFFDRKWISGAQFSQHARSTGCLIITFAVCISSRIVSFCHMVIPWFCTFQQSPHSVVQPAIQSGHHDGSMPLPPPHSESPQWHPVDQISNHSQRKKNVGLAAETRMEIAMTDPFSFRLPQHTLVHEIGISNNLKGRFISLGHE